MYPEKIPSDPNGRSADFLFLFNQFVITGLSLGAFKAAFELAKLWLEQRQNCEVTLKFPDGSQMKVSNLAHDQAEHIWESHFAKFYTPRSSISV
jgi:hypothetical protein